MSPATSRSLTFDTRGFPSSVQLTSFSLELSFSKLRLPLSFSRLDHSSEFFRIFMDAPSIPVGALKPRLYPTKLSLVFSSTFKTSPLPARAPPNCTPFLVLIYTSEVSGLCLLTISGGSFTSSKYKRLLSSKKSVVPGGSCKLISIKLREVPADFAPSDSRFPSVTMVPLRRVVDSPLLNSISSVRVNVLSLMTIIKSSRLLPFIPGRTTSNTLPAAPVPPRVSFFPIAI